MPLWLTETNATPYDDPARGLARPPNGIRVTMDQQSSFVLQAMAMGLTAGYERLAIHSLTDRDTTDELWGLMRNDGTLRPAFVAYQTAARYLGGADRVEFAGRELPLEPDWERGRVTLAGATAHSPLDPEGFYYVGGDPVLLVEDGVAEGAPVVPPEIAA